ncbi:hypothetical protein [Bauldia sp.]|uniref:hypothetical protein n=1 Tax=Bauldia sp. TaxID=2575872 RepID=UPI003BABD528
MRYQTMVRLCVAIVFAGGLAGMASAESVTDLTPDAQKIVAQVEKENPDIQPVCSSMKELRAAVTQATTELAKAGDLTEDPHTAGEEAGKFLFENCPPSS